jgi:hypothetical protein
MHDTSPCKVLYVYTRTSAAKYQSPASLQARRQLQPNLPLPCFSRTQHAEAAAAAFPQTASPSRACYHTDAVTRTHSPAIAGGRSRSHRSLPSHDRQHHRVRPSSTCPVACAPSDQRWSLLLFRRWQAASKRSQTNRPRMPWSHRSRRDQDCSSFFSVRVRSALRPIKRPLLMNPSAGKRDALMAHRPVPQPLWSPLLEVIS